MLTSAPYSLFESYEDGFFSGRLIAESGGYQAVARGPAMDVIYAEFENSLFGYPMLAGLVLILSQIFKDHHGDMDIVAIADKRMSHDHRS